MQPRIPDPFAGLTDSEKKRAIETAILQMAYPSGSLETIQPGERPDFVATLPHTGNRFGVEVTQMFPTESHARLTLKYGYDYRLWEGGAHIHRDDVEVLSVATFEVTSADGVVKASNVPGILTKLPTNEEFRVALAATIRGKSSKGYMLANMSHLNLVVFDWFGMDFDATSYETQQFFDASVRRALVDSPFREVHLVLMSGPSAVQEPDGDVASSVYRVVPLQQLLALERMFVTGHLIDAEPGVEFSDIADLNAVVVDHVSRVQGYGSPVSFEDGLYLEYRSSLVQIDEQGTRIVDLHDSALINNRPVVISDRMPQHVEDRVTAAALESGMVCGYTRPAGRESIWRSAADHQSPGLAD